MTVTDEHRDKLARAIDPEAWELYDDPRVVKQGQAWRDLIVQDSREIADRVVASGLMAALEWDRAEYIRARQYIIEHTSKSGRCESVEDILDGYFKHDPRCIHWPEGAIGGSSCVK